MQKVPLKFYSKKFIVFYENGKLKNFHIAPSKKKIIIKHEWFSIMKYHKLHYIIMVEIVVERKQEEEKIAFQWLFMAKCKQIFSLN